MATTERRPHGWLKTFVLEHVNAHADSPTTEADRLLPILRRTGKQTTRNSMIQAVRTYARQANGNGNGATRKKKMTPAARSAVLRRQIVEETPAVPAEIPATATPLRSGDDLIRDLGEAQVMLATLAVDVGAASTLVARLVAEMQARRERLERFRAEL